MKALLVLVVVCSFARAASALPTGIPAPSFGLSERPGAFTHFVNNTHAAATDSNNPRGTASRPRLTVPTTLPAGSVVEVRGGPYSTGLLTWTSQGTRTAPVFVIGVNKPVFLGNASGYRLRTAGTYMIVDGLTFVGVKHELVGVAIAIRRCEILLTNTTAVAISGHHSVLYLNSIHHNGDANAVDEFDTHGVAIVDETSYTWVLQNHIYENGGDGIQVGSTNTNAISASRVFIGGNMIHEDRENGIDIKRAADVTVSSNVIYGYAVRNSSAGEAIVVHNGPERVWIVNNFVGYSNQGIVCTGANGYYVVGNLIHGIQHAPSLPYDPWSMYGASGIMTYSTTNSVHVNNTIWASDAGISIPSNGATEVVNNIAGGLTGATTGIRVADSVRRAAETVVANNLDIDPGFVSADTGNFQLAAGSLAVDTGTAHWIFAAFESLNRVPLGRDIYGTSRVVNGAIDVGATEYK